MQHGFIDLCILNCYFPNLYIFIIHNNVSLFYCGRPDGCPKHDERPVGAGVISYPRVSSRADAAACCGSHRGRVFAPPASHPTRCHPPIPNDGELADSGCLCSYNNDISMRRMLVEELLYDSGWCVLLSPWRED